MNQEELINKNKLLKKKERLIKIYSNDRKRLKRSVKELMEAMQSLENEL